MFETDLLLSSTNCIIRNISVNFEVGNIYFITGKSGSGKTTFLDILAGLYNFDSSLSLSYLYHGNVIDSDEVISISYVKQDNTLFSHTIRQFLTYGLGKYVTDESIWQILFLCTYA